MPKKYASIGNGFISFADPESPNEVLKFSNGRRKARSGITQINSRVNLVVPGWVTVNPGCDDKCATLPHDDSITFQMSNVQATDAASRLVLKNRITAFFNDILHAVDEGLVGGTLPSPMTSFDGTDPI